MIYVDELRKITPSKAYPFSHSCHMIADTSDELHEFAQKLGLMRRWAHTSNGMIEHYDLTAKKREEAIQQGAIPIANKELIFISQQQKQHVNQYTSAN
jgi:hypothetical protein